MPSQLLRSVIGFFAPVVMAILTDVSLIESYDFCIPVFGISIIDECIDLGAKIVVGALAVL